jgi:site-specific recombinase XerD
MDANIGKNELTMFSPATTPIPAAIADCGDKASERFFTFFTDTIRNKNTRAAYYRNAMRFFAWAAARNLGLPAIKSYHVSAYLEELSLDLAASSVKQHLATLRMLFDWLILGRVLEISPAAAVRGPAHVVKKGKTPVLNAEAGRQLLDGIGDGDLIRLRDRALISVCLYSFARIEAALGMDVGDYYPNGK